MYAKEVSYTTTHKQIIQKILLRKIQTCVCKWHCCFREFNKKYIKLHKIRCYQMKKKTGIGIKYISKQYIVLQRDMANDKLHWNEEEKRTISKGNKGFIERRFIKSEATKTRTDWFLRKLQKMEKENSSSVLSHQREPSVVGVEIMKKETTYKTEKLCSLWHRRKKGEKKTSKIGKVQDAQSRVSETGDV